MPTPNELLKATRRTNIGKESARTLHQGECRSECKHYKMSRCITHLCKSNLCSKRHVCALLNSSAAGAIQFQTCVEFNSPCNGSFENIIVVVFTKTHLRKVKTGLPKKWVTDWWRFGNYLWYQHKRRMPFLITKKGLSSTWWRLTADDANSKHQANKSISADGANFVYLLRNRRASVTLPWLHCGFLVTSDEFPMVSISIQSCRVQHQLTVTSLLWIHSHWSIKTNCFWADGPVILRYKTSREAEP